MKDSISGFTRPDAETGRDIAVILFCSLALFAATCLTGPGWGLEAALQSACITGSSGGGEIFPDLFRVPAHVFVLALPFGNPAAAVNLFCVLLSVVTLLVVYSSMRLCNIPGRTALIALAALALSQAFFSHATRPNTSSLAILLLALELHFMLHFVHSRRVGDATIAVCFGLLAGLVQPVSIAASFLPLVWLGLRLKFVRPKLFAAWLVMLFLMSVLTSDFGLHAPWILLVYVAFQFPFAGWLLMPWGSTRLLRRAPLVFEILITMFLSAMPWSALAAQPMTFREHLDVLLPASLSATILIAFGLDHLYALRALRKERILFMTPVLAFTLSVLPIATTAAFVYLAHSSGLEHRIVTMAAPRARLLGSSWSNALWYAMWPLKRSDGSGSFIVDVEKSLPPAAVLIADPEIMPVVDYARRVEKRLPGIRARMLSPGDREADLENLARQAGILPVYLGGVDPEFHAVEEMGRRGELLPAGLFLEWKPAPER